MQIESESFWIGFIVAFIFVSLLGRISQQIAAARSRRSLPDRPMTIATTETPRQVIRTAANAQMAVIGWTILLLLLLGVIGVLIFYILWINI